MKERESVQFNPNDSGVWDASEMVSKKPAVPEVESEREQEQASNYVRSVQFTQAMQPTQSTQQVRHHIPPNSTSSFRSTQLLNSEQEYEHPYVSNVRRPSRATGSAKTSRPRHALGWCAALDPLLVVAVLLVVVSTVVRGLLADFPKTVDVMPDELRYLDLARSLFLDGTLTIQGQASSFQKILYPLSLFPALFFNDPLDQVKAISWLNAFYASSSLIPAALLAKRIIPKRAARFVALGLVFFLPDMCYSITFMSESLYLPLSLWLLLLLWELFASRGIRSFVLAGFAGVTCYLAYLCKEMALAYVIVVGCYLGIKLLRSLVRFIKVGSERKLNPCLRLNLSEDLLRFLSFLTSFLLLFCIMKLTLFGGLSNSYNQFSFDILHSLYVDMFTLHAVLLNAVYFLLAFAIFPLLIPLASLKSFTWVERRFLVLVLSVLLLSFVTIIFTISLREDAGHIYLRQHIRYVGPLLVPLVLYLVRVAFDHKRLTWGQTLGKGHVLTALVAAFSIGILLLLGQGNLTQGFDAASLHIFALLKDMAAVLPSERFDGAQGALVALSDDEPLLEIDAVLWCAQVLIVVLMIVGLRAFYGRGRTTRVAGALVLVLVFLHFVGNTVVCTQNMREAYDVDESSVREVRAIDKTLSDLPPETHVLIVTDEGNTLADNLVTTYIPDRKHRYHFVSESTIKNQASADEKIGVQIFGFEQPNEIAQTYVLVNSSQDIEVTSPGVSIVAHEPSVRYVLYSVPTGQPLEFKLSDEAEEAS